MRNSKELNQIGKNAYAAILEMVETLQKADDDATNTYVKDGADVADAYEKAREAAREAIEQDPLSIEVRAGWWSLGEGDPDNTPEEYRILLGTGGPAVRIVGELGAHGEPSSATLQVQDWGTPWTDYRKADDAILMAYVGVFAFDAYQY